MNAINSKPRSKPNDKRTNVNIQLGADDRRSGELPELTESDSLVVREVLVEDGEEEDAGVGRWSSLLVVGGVVVAVEAVAEEERLALLLRPGGALEPSTENNNN